MRYRILFYLIPMFIGFQTLYAQGPSTQNQVFRAGASTSNITPYLETLLVGAFSPTPAQNVHDELHARTLALDDGTSRLVFVITDLLMIERKVIDTTKQIIHERTGLPTDHILISAVHNHYGPSAEGSERKDWNYYKPLDDYQKFLVRRMVDGVEMALNNLEPAEIGWGVVPAPEHVFNRRWVMKEPYMNPLGEMDKVRFNPGVGNPDAIEPAGPVDPDLSFISVRSTSGKPIALLANYSLHYVGGIPKGDISADYFAVFANKIQDLLDAHSQDPPFVGIMTNGTSGDINNINVRGAKEKHAPYEKMKIVADDLAQKVLQANKEIEFHDWVPLGAAQYELRLGVRKPDAEEFARVKRILERPEDAKPLYQSRERIFATRALQLEENWPDTIGIPLQAFRIGSLGIASAPFEIFAETGLEIKSKSPFETTFTIELANGAYGYLPTPEQHELGGYETWMGSNKVEKDATVKIVSKLISLFAELN